MSTPVRRGTNSFTNSSAATTHTLPLPAGVQQYDRIVLFCVPDADVTATSPGYTVVDSQSGVGCRLVILTKIAGASESNPVITIGASNRFAGRSWAFSNHMGALQTNLDASVSTADPDPPGVNPSWGTSADSMMVLTAAATGAGPTAGTVAQPSGYTNETNLRASVSGSFLASAYKAAALGSLEDPGIFDGTTVADYVTATVAIRPAATPDKLALVLATFAPTVTVRDNKLATPGKVSLVLTAFVPTVPVGGVSVTVTPATAALALTSFVPTIRLPKLATPGKVSLALSSFVPTIRLNKIATPTPASLALSSFVPVVRLPKLVTPPKASLVLASFVPAVLLRKMATPTPAALTLTTAAPTVRVPRLVTPPKASLVLTSFAPAVTSGIRVFCAAPTALLLAFYAPSARTPRVVTPSRLSLVLATSAPVIVLPRTVTPAKASLVLTLFTPTAIGRQSALVVPLTLALILTLYAPDILIPPMGPIPGSGSGRFFGIRSGGGWFGRLRAGRGEFNG